MKQKIITIIATLLTILVCVLLIATRGTAKAINPNSEKIAQLTYQISELEYQKMMCLDDLSRNQSKDQMNGFTKYCVEYDEQIMLLQSEIDELSERKDEKEETIRGESRGEISEEELIAYEQYSSGKISKEERYAGKIVEDEMGVHQEMPNIEGDDSHDKFKKMSEAYGLDASQIRAVENHYGIKEGVILCITVAETSGGNRGAGGKNIGSVGSNDRGDRPTYALMESGLEDIGKTLNNRYLGKIQTLGCLSNAGSCQSRDDNGKRYATSDGNRERNMTACLSTIYGKINPAEFSIRR